MSKTKLEQVLSLLINEESDKASDLLHDIFVEKSRAIYAEMIEEDIAIEDDLDESIDDSDFGDDFEDDITSSGDEIDAEEALGEDDDFEGEDEFASDGEGEAEFELGDDLLGDEGGEEEFDMDSEDAGTDSEEADAVLNIIDAVAELKAVFADIVGDDVEGDELGADEFDMDSEGEEEFEMDSDEEGFEMDSEDDQLESLGENAELKKAQAPKGVTADSTKSPVGPGDKNLGKGKPVNIAGSDEKGGKAPSSNKMSVKGPQEAGKGAGKGRLQRVTKGAAKGTKG